MTTANESATLPNRIRALRKERGLTQRQVAAAVGCSHVQISDLERGKRSLDLDWMRRLAEPLAANPAQLLEVKDNPDHLGSEEQLIVRLYRNLTDIQKKQFWKIAEIVFTPTVSNKSADLKATGA